MNYKINALLGLFLLLNYYSHAQRQDSSEKISSALSERKTQKLNSKFEYFNEKAQDRLRSKDSVYFYIDSVRIDYDKYVIGIKSIISVNVIQDKTYTHNGGKIYMSLKKGTVFKSLYGIVKEHTKDNQNLITSYTIDEKTNVDSVGVKIDTSCIKKAKIVKDSLGKYIFTIITKDFEKRKSYKKKTSRR